MELTEEERKLLITWATDHGRKRANYETFAVFHEMNPAKVEATIIRLASRTPKLMNKVGGGKNAELTEAGEAESERQKKLAAQRALEQQAADETKARLEREEKSKPILVQLAGKRKKKRRWRIGALVIMAILCVLGWLKDDVIKPMFTEFVSQPVMRWIDRHRHGATQPTQAEGKQ